MVDPLCSPYVLTSSSTTPCTKCSLLLTEISSKSRNFIKSQPRSLNLDVAKTSATKTCWVVADAYLHLSHLGTFTSSSLIRCPIKWQCPVSNPVNILGRFLLRSSNSATSFAEGFSRKPMVCLCPHMDCQCSSCFLHIQSHNNPLANFTGIPTTISGPMSGYEEPTLTVSFPSMPMCPITHTSWTLLFCQFHQWLMNNPRLVWNISENH